MIICGRLYVVFIEKTEGDTSIQLALISVILKLNFTRKIENTLLWFAENYMKLCFIRKKKGQYRIKENS